MVKKYKQALQNHQIIRNKPLLQHQDIKSQLIVLPELEELIPPPKENEFQQLENNVLKDGCREALLVWENDLEDDTSYVLIDGHNRYAICKKHHLDFRINLLQFDSLKEVKEYMINNQLGRRNLSREQASFLRGMRYQNEKAERGKYDREHKPQNEVNDHLRTSERLAEEYKVSKNTIERDAEFALGLEKIGKANADLKRSILTGNIKVAKAKIQRLSRLEEPLSINSPADINVLLTQRLSAKDTSPVPESESGKKIQQQQKNIDKKIAEKKQQLHKLSQQIHEQTLSVALLDRLMREAYALKRLLQAEN